MTKPTILIVDDEPANLAVFVKLLGEIFRLRACKSGDQALAIARLAPQPDLILLDVMMPGMDGYQVLQQLREDQVTCDIPVIFVTALSEDLDEEKGLRLGAVDYVVKPVRPAILLARVRAHLELKRARDRLAAQNDWLEAEVERRGRENRLIQELSMSVILELAETRDTETGNHILRTQTYVALLADQLCHVTEFAEELREPRRTWIAKAAPLHDIGKIGIPDRILLKPGKLSPEEWTVMQTHSQLGAEVIARAIDKAGLVESASATREDPPSQTLETLRIARVIALRHHEQWNGSGYPDGISGAAIPLPARLMALADVYDALTMRRVYKPAWSAEEAQRFIIEQRGRHFDPAVTDAFVAIAEEFNAVRRRLADPLPVGEPMERET